MPPLPTFREWITRLRPSFNGNVYKAMMGVAGTIIGDKTGEETNQSLVEELPLYASADALGLLLSERGLDPDPALSLDDLRLFCDAGIALNRFRGRPVGILTALYYGGFPGAVLVQQNGIAYQITAAPSLSALRWSDNAGIRSLPSWITKTTLGDGNPAIPASHDGRPAIPINTVSWWNFDSDMDSDPAHPTWHNQYTSRFAIVFPSDVPDPGLGTPSRLARIRRIIKAWRDASATCVYIEIVQAGESWDWPPGTWDHPVDTWPATAVVRVSAE